MATGEHLSISRLAAYRAAHALEPDPDAGLELVAEEVEQMTAHLADCAACSELATKLSALESAWDEWTPHAHGEAYRSYLAAVGQLALETLTQGEDAAAAPTPWRDRLTAWRSRWHGRGSGAFRVAVERAAARVVEEIQALASPTFALAAAPATRGRVVSKGFGAAQGWVDADRQGDHLTITVEGLDLPTSQAAPLVVLATAEEGGTTRVAALERQPEGFYLARFEDVPDGDCVVLIEPVERGPR